MLFGGHFACFHGNRRQQTLKKTKQNKKKNLFCNAKVIIHLLVWITPVKVERPKTKQKKNKQTKKKISFALPCLALNV